MSHSYERGKQKNKVRTGSRTAHKGLICSLGNGPWNELTMSMGCEITVGTRLVRNNSGLTEIRIIEFVDRISP